MDGHDFTNNIRYEYNTNNYFFLLAGSLFCCYCARYKEHWNTSMQRSKVGEVEVAAAATAVVV